jgi:hypothetical protein
MAICILLGHRARSGEGRLVMGVSGGPSMLYGLCVPPDVPNATTCVPSNIRYTVNFPDA